MSKPTFAFKATAAAVLLGTAVAANAESNFKSNAGAQTATANLDFQITIPKILFLQVGTGTTFADNATKDFITFAPPAARIGLGCGTASDCAGAGGDQTNGAVTAVLLSNAGSVTINANTSGGVLNDGGTNTIPYSKILVASTALAVPPIAGSSLWTFPGWDTSTTYTPAAATVTNLSAKWTFTYANNTIPPAGVYGGQNVNKGRVAFTATAP
ncbi:MAG TPA: hypothetical protein PLW68_08955 [Casimicrobiaceae bacterium]|nr:hypothetical protein [Casimicrobiaceae bacterium]